jgi:hypothetical protein
VTGGVSLLPPSDPDVAPAGWYMLFLLNDDGVPSAARWVLLGSSPAPLGRIEITARVEPGATATSSARFRFSGAQFDEASLAPGTTTARALPAGRYVVTQLLTPGYDFVSVSCDGSASTSTSERLASIRLSAGQTVRCTFSNKKRPAPPPAEEPRAEAPPAPAEKDTEGPSVAVTKLSRRGVLVGTIGDTSGVKRLKVAVAKARKGRCRWWSRRSATLVRARVSCLRERWLTARVWSSRGRLAWGVVLGRRVPRGRYLVAWKARDKRNNLSSLTGKKAPRLRARR